MGVAHVKPCAGRNDAAFESAAQEDAEAALFD